jgi:hypothetical protein
MVIKEIPRLHSLGHTNRPCMKDIGGLNLLSIKRPGVILSTHLHPVLGQKTVELYLHSVIRLLGSVPLIKDKDNFSSQSSIPC